MKKINIGIIGGAGYTAGELIRILLYHEHVKIQFVHSNSHAGQAISVVHKDLIGESNLIFTNKIEKNIELLFLCMGHGKSIEFLNKNQFSNKLKIIDLSQDFRIKNSSHDFVYGLPELNKKLIEQSSKIANCGCFATTIQLALLPLANAQILNNEVHVHAITGATGAGQQARNTTHFSWRSNNISAYKIFQHQHLKEIKQSLQQLQNDFQQDINFIPIRGDFARGIFASIYTQTTLAEAELIDMFDEYYAEHPFVLINKENPDLKQVIGTNKCILHIKKSGNKVIIISVIDNLIKGASGQAVQNMNLLFGLNQRTGLRLKAIAF